MFALNKILKQKTGKLTLMNANNSLLWSQALPISFMLLCSKSII